MWFTKTVVAEGTNSFGLFLLHTYCSKTKRAASFRTAFMHQPTLLFSFLPSVKCWLGVASLADRCAVGVHPYVDGQDIVFTNAFRYTLNTSSILTSSIWISTTANQMSFPSLS